MEPEPFPPAAARRCGAGRRIHDSGRHAKSRRINGSSAFALNRKGSAWPRTATRTSTMSASTELLPSERQVENREVGEQDGRTVSSIQAEEHRISAITEAGLAGENVRARG